MNFKEVIAKTQKIVLYLLLFAFILLNILDFFNFFSLISSNTGDVDFFKKILSWSLIYYLFSTLSLSKIITGFKSKSYDILLLISYGLIVFPSILNFYLNNVDFRLYDIFSFVINSSFKEIIASYNIFALNIGIIILLVVSVLIFLNLPIHKESFIGSFSINPHTYFSNLLKLVLIIGFNLFFVFTFFRFFMEWFALAIDAALILLGLIYYIYVYIFKHEKELKLDSFLKDIVNSGNTFFKQIILYLQNKKTFFIAISLLITIHLVVDIGVYLIPFSTGIDNGLYNVLSNTDSPLKPLIGFDDSWLKYQINALDNNISITDSTSSYIISLLVLLFELFSYLLNISLYLILLVMPFAIFFATLQNRVIIPSKFLTIITLSMITMQLFLQFSPIVNNTISLSVSLEEEMQGIVYQTQPFYENLDSLSLFEIISTTIIILCIFIFIISMIYIKFEKYKPFWISTFYFAILVFFLFYATVFAQSYITSLYYENFESKHLEFDAQLAQQSFMYEDISYLITSNNISKSAFASISNQDFKVKSDYYLTSQIKNISFDTIGIEIEPINDFAKQYSLQEIPESKLEVIIYNYSSLSSNTYNNSNIFIIITVPPNKSSEYINFYGTKSVLEINKLGFINSKGEESHYSLVQAIVSLVFISLFYIGGLVAYAIFYRKVVENMKQKLFIRNTHE